MLDSWLTAHVLAGTWAVMVTVGVDLQNQRFSSTEDPPVFLD